MKTTPSVIIRIFIWLVLILGGIALSLYFDFKYFKSLLFNPLFHIITLIIGYFVLKFAFHAAAVGGRELNRYGREGDIPRLETNKLVTSGIYECTRHPMLFGLVLLPFGIALFLGLPSFILFIAPLEAFFIFIMVITLEEKEAYMKFGEDYLKYKEKTPLFPKTKECFKKLFFD
ncbi:methyltransferase family protein [Nautilia lithotrophica]